jgi:probable rRNA maturation factor
MNFRIDLTNDLGSRGDFPVRLPELSSILGDLLGGLAESGSIGANVALTLESEEGIRELNARYRNIDEPTDVLSFPLWERDGVFSPPLGWGDLPLGDVVVCPGFVRADADGRSGNYEKDLALVIIHGVLHTMGFDHDTEEREREMWGLQDEFVKKYERMLMKQ